MVNFLSAYYTRLVKFCYTPPKKIFCVDKISRNAKIAYMETLISGRYFEWDDEKAESNWKKHRVKFETAVRVFDDDNLYEEYDELHSDEEDRWKVIGMVDDILLVICTYRAEATRLISARKATSKERRDYYAGEKMD